MSEFEPKNPDYEARVREVWDHAAFVKDVGIDLVSVEPGIIESELVLTHKHLQQDGVAHAGVMATMADHTAGAAGASLMPAGKIVLSIEFKINMLRPASGDSLRCIATVIKAGKNIIVAEAEVYGVKDRDEKLVSKATVSLAVADPLIQTPNLKLDKATQESSPLN